MREWDDEFEKLWGFRVTLVADQWRKTQSEQQSQIGRTYHVDSVSQRDGAPAFAVATSDATGASAAGPPAKTSRSHSGSSASGPSSTRSSPRNQHSAARRSSLHGNSPPRQPVARQPYAHDGMVNGPVGAVRDIANANTTRTLQPQQSLPSLKASGLLDVSRIGAPPTEAFAATSISGVPDRSGHGHSQSLGRNNINPSAVANNTYGWLDDQH